MELNLMVVTVLESLLSSEGHMPVSELIQRLGISKRILDYNVKKLNYVLEQGGFPQIVSAENHLTLDVSRGEEIRSWFSVQPLGEYVLSVQERKLLITLSAGLMDEKISIEELCRLMSVSRNTVLDDIAQLKKKLIEQGLTLEGRGRQGYQITGDELTLRYSLYESMIGLETEFTRAIFEQMLISALRLRGTRFENRNELFAWLETVIQQAEDCIDGRYNHNSIAEIRDYILLIICRAGRGNLYLDTGELRKTPEYQMSVQIREMLSSRGIELPEQELDYLTTVLLGAKLYSYSEVARRDNADLRRITEDLIEIFESKACIRFSNRRQFADQFIVHLRPMYYRLKYRVKVRNLVYGEMRQEYRGIFDLTRTAVAEFEERLGLTIPDEELAYLSAYLLTWLKRQHLSKRSREQRILIVCGAGVGTSLLLRQQISEILGIGYQYETRDVREVAELELNDYDLVVSTVDLPISCRSYLRANPVLTARQKERLLDWSCAHPDQDDIQRRVDQVMKTVERYGAIQDRTGLMIELRQCFEREQVERGGNGLWEVLTPGMVRICTRTVDEGQGVRLACARLTEHGLVDKAYADCVLEIIDQLGLYAEISPGVLLVHAKPDAGVHGVGLSLTVFREQIEFKKWGKQIAAIFTLCTPDNQSHLRLLQELMQLLDSEAVRSILVQCPYKSPERLYRFLRQNWDQQAR